MDRYEGLFGEDAEAVRVVVDALIGRHPERGGSERDQAAYEVVKALKPVLARSGATDWSEMEGNEYVGRLRLDDGDGGVVTLVFRVGAAAEPVVFLSPAAIEKMPSEYRTVWGDG